MTDNEKVRAIRLKMDLSMDKFGALLGVSGTAISLIESGKNNVSDRIKVNIISVLGVNPEYFKADNVPMFPPRTRKQEIASFFREVENAPEDSIKSRLIQVLAELDESQWQLIADMAKKLTEKEKDPDGV